MRKVTEQQLADRIAAGAKTETRLARPKVVTPALGAATVSAAVDTAMQRVLQTQGDMIKIVLEQLAAMKTALSSDGTPKKLKVTTFRDEADNLVAEIEVVEREENP